MLGSCSYFYSGVKYVQHFQNPGSRSVKNLNKNLENINLGNAKQKLKNCVPLCISHKTQGSILDPLLFIIYIKRFERCRLFLCADDNVPVIIVKAKTHDELHNKMSNLSFTLRSSHFYDEEIVFACVENQPADLPILKNGDKITLNES